MEFYVIVCEEERSPALTDIIEKEWPGIRIFLGGGTGPRGRWNSTGTLLPLYNMSQSSLAIWLTS